MAIPIYATVLSQINTYIVANGNNEITANVLNPILKIMLDFANNNIGDLDTLTTDEKNSVVEAINSLKQNFDDLVNNGVQLYTGIDDPNVTPPPTYKYADFYMQLDIDSLPVKLWQWNGFIWTDASQEPATESDNVVNNSDVDGVTVTDALNTLDTGKADDSNVLHKTGNETKTGILTIANILNLASIIVNSTDGFITKGGQPFIHNFYAGVNPLQGGSGNNLNVGVNSGNFNSDNFNYASTMLGFESGLSNKNGYSNVGIGYRNLHLNENGFGNSALGTYVLGNLTNGTQNTAIGWHSMLYSTTASENTAVGVEALWNNLIGLRNTALGMRAGTSNTGDDNVFIGYNAGGAYTGSNKLYIANTNRTLIEGDFSGNGFVTLNGAGEFMVAPSRKITFKNVSGVEASLGWFSNLNTETNAYLDAFDYRIRTGGTVRLQISNAGVASFSSTVNAGVAASSANDLMRKGETDTALALKANLASPALTGTPTAPTAAAGTNTTQVATTAFVQNIKPYKTWVGNLTQTSTNAPVATIYENTLGGTITWARTATGNYSATLTGAFTSGKTFLLINNANSSTNRIFSVWQNANTIYITTVNGGTFLQIDDVLLNTSFEIRVYP